MYIQSHISVFVLSYYIMQDPVTQTTENIGLYSEELLRRQNVCTIDMPEYIANGSGCLLVHI